MAKGRRPCPDGFRRVLDRRRSGAPGPHQGRTQTRGAENRAAVHNSQEGK